ncbi:MAG: HugZ family pyridoxamine 5'-phosphate oxidase [Alphaproteobacteria bacterium]
MTAHAARRIIRLAMTAVMATIEPDNAGPHVSLVGVATAVDCTPIVLMSQLSRHTANSRSNPQVSLLFDGTAALDDRLSGGRVAVSGTLVPSTDNSHEQRFLARHQNAFYAEFGDFDWFRLEIDRAIFVAGFGRVRKFSKSRLLLAPDQCAELVSTQANLLLTLNGKTAQGTGQPATSESAPNPQPTPWSAAGVDPEGLDLVHKGAVMRHDFATMPTTGPQALAHIAHLRSIAQPGDPIFDLAHSRTD